VSAPVVIDRIETAGPARRARRLVLSDGRTRLTSAAVVRVLALEPGSAVDDSELAETEMAQARERAFRVLGYRDRSAAELAKKLSDDGYPHDVVAAITDRLAELDLVNDVRFAETWVRMRSASGYGPHRVARELAEKGVDKQIAQDALHSVEGPSELERARLVLGTRTAADPRERDRLMRRLVTRGFSFETARAALDGASDEDETAP